MKKSTVLALSISILVVILLTTYTVLSFKIPTIEIEKRTGVEGQQKKCMVHQANMWNILKEKAGVTEQYKGSFEKVFPQMVDKEFSNDQNVMVKFFQQNFPEFKTDLLNDLMQSIKIERTGFTTEQDFLIDMQREHKNYIMNKFNKLFLDSDLKEVEIKLITSSRTNAIYESGVEDDIDLFDSKK